MTDTASSEHLTASEITEIFGGPFNEEAVLAVATRDLADAARRFAAEHPEAAALSQEFGLFVKLYDNALAIANERPTDDCARCGQPVVATEGVWHHRDRAKSRGCRAASYTDADGWDDTLNSRWTAEPRSQR